MEYEIKPNVLWSDQDLIHITKLTHLMVSIDKYTFFYIFYLKFFLQK